MPRVGQVAPHGTTTRYQYHGCRCDECREAVVANQQHRKGVVPLAPFAAVLQAWLVKGSNGTIEDLAELLAIDISNLRKLVNGRRANISFNTADRIMCACAGGLYGWTSNPETRQIYESFDFRYLDKQKPLVGEAA